MEKALVSTKEKVRKQNYKYCVQNFDKLASHSVPGKCIKKQSNRNVYVCF